MRTMRDAMNTGETLVFGHRGAMAQAPMNTLAAFESRAPMESSLMSNCRGMGSLLSFMTKRLMQPPTGEATWPI